MKNIIRGFCAACMMTFVSGILSVQAQTIMFGGKAGINVNNISSPNVEGEFKTNFKPGFHLGPFIQVRMGKRVSFRHEMLFMMKGFNSSVRPSDTVSATDYKVSYYYLDLPWLLNYHITDRFMVNVGVVPSLFLGGNVPGDFKKTIFDKINVAPIDFSPMIGVEGYFTENFGAGMRFTYSTVPVIDVEGHTPKLYTIQLYASFGKYAGVRLGKKRKR